MTIWLLFIDDNGTISCGTYSSEANAITAKADYCRAHWDRMRDELPHEASVDMDDDQAVAHAFFGLDGYYPYIIKTTLDAPAEEDV